jgi:glycosyltransferase involved in cell wall biosynthesis
MPLVGLGMTCFNRDRFLTEAIQSVACQTFTDWRLVVVDDGSDDDSLQIAQSWVANDSRIKVIANSENRGPGYSLNRALGELDDCSFIGWVDSDDMLHPDSLTKTVQYLDLNPDCDMVYTHYNTMDVLGRDRGLGSRCKIPYSSHRLLTEFMVFHFRLMRRVKYKAIGGIDPTLPTAIDYDFALRFAEKHSIHCLPESLYSYRIHNESLSIAAKRSQLEQSIQSINRALVRRGLSDSLRLQVDTKLRLVEVP